MIKTEMCELLGIKHPIIQAGMGPFSNNKLSIAAANAGVLGLLSTSGIGASIKDAQRKIYDHWIETAGAEQDDDRPTLLRKALNQTLKGTEESQGVFGINVMVSAELKEDAELFIDTAIKATQEDPELKKRFKVIFTSAGAPLSSKCDYRIEGEELPTRWWAITVYGEDHFLIPNPQKRYSFNKNDVKRDKQGIYSILLSGAEKDGDWIPTGDQEQRLILTLRLYNPEPVIYEQPEKVALPRVIKEGCK